MTDARSWIFSPFRLDTGERRLWRTCAEVPLRPKSFAVLQTLVQHAGRTLSRDDLVRAVWGATRVSDSVLRECIREVRQALGDSAQAPRYVATVAGRGWRFVAAVAAAESPPPATTPPCPATPPPAVPRRADAEAAPLVGRDEELARLDDWLAQARDGAPQLVFVTGEPGIGKTALLATFLARAARDTDVLVLRGQCIEPYGANDTCMPVLTAIDHLCRDDPALGGRLRALAPFCAAQLPGVAPASPREGLSPQLALDPQNRLAHEIGVFLESLSAACCVVLVLEDLHWSDRATIGLLAHLVRRARVGCLFALGTYRPVELAATAHPLRALVQELGGHGLCHELALGALDDGTIDAYLRARFPRSALPIELARVLWERTEGNPLFLVATVAELVERAALTESDGTWSLQVPLADVPTRVPESLRLLVARQMDRLGAAERRLLEAASLAGAEFPAVAVAAALGGDVAEIEALAESLADRQAFLRRAGIVTWPDGTTTSRYGFLHTVFQELWHERVPVSRRQRWHQRIGERLQDAWGARGWEIASELAMHYEQAGDASRAGRSFLEAGEKVLRRNGYDEAVAHLTRGLTLVTSLPDTRERLELEAPLQLALGFALLPTRGYTAPEVERAFTRALALFQHTRDTSRLFNALAGLWVYSLFRGQYRTTQELAERMRVLARHAEGPRNQIRASAFLGVTRHILGDLVAAREHVEQSVGLYDPQAHRAWVLEHPVVGPYLLAVLAPILWQLGYPDQASARAEEAVALANELQHPFSHVQSLLSATLVHRARGEVARTAERAEATVTMATAEGIQVGLVHGMIYRGWAAAHRSAGAAGVEEIRAGIAAWRAAGGVTAVPQFLTLLAEACHARGEGADGLAAVDEALAVIDATGEHCVQAWAEATKGELLLARARSRRRPKGAASARRADTEAAAEAILRQAIATARRQAARSSELRATTCLARLLRTRRRTDEARRLLAEIYGWFTEGFDTADLRAARALLDELGG